jgi:D-sedoheptulose 7-phosphate isomerase
VLESSNLVAQYVSTLGNVLTTACVTDASGAEIALAQAVTRLGQDMRQAHDRGNRIFFVGNGGSAGICSHLATDFSKNGGMRALALNDSAVLTCLGNDYGYEQVFAKQIEWHAGKGDILVAISSSGQSANILNAVQAGRLRGCHVVTFSGFRPENPLRRLGDMNFYLAYQQYGIVEVGHLALLHSVLDIQMGWRQ